MRKYNSGQPEIQRKADNMMVNVYIRNEDGRVMMEQVQSESINDAVEIICSYLEDGFEVIFAEDNLHPMVHSF